MSISGGGDRSELRPLRPDGSVDHDMADHVVVGNHKGQYAGFNVVDPRPGTVHQYGTRRDVLSARQRGWWVADPERDGHPAYDMAELYHSDLATPLTRGDTPYPEYVHLVTTEENYRRLMEEQLERNREQLAPAGLGYLEAASREEFETGRTAQGHLATRFATRDHGTFVTNEDGRVLEHLTPQGILREENL